MIRNSDFSDDACEAERASSLSNASLVTSAVCCWRATARIPFGLFHNDDAVASDIIKKVLALRDVCLIHLRSCVLEQLLFKGLQT